MRPILWFVILVATLLTAGNALTAPAETLPSKMANRVLIPAGSFLAGLPDSLTARRVPAFYMDRFEVTQERYQRVMGKNLSFFKAQDRPVENVTWDDANLFCKRSGQRLPTEWEWEKAAKAGTVTRYHWGEVMDDSFAWHQGNSNKQTHPVGRKKANGFGLYDMAGNVWEWTASDHDAGGKVLRGGSWRNSQTSLRSAHRITGLPIFKHHYVGFRCAQSALSNPLP